MSTWRSGSSQLLRRSQLMWGSNLFHVGILIIFLGLTNRISNTVWSLKEDDETTLLG